MNSVVTEVQSKKSKIREALQRTASAPNPGAVVAGQVQTSVTNFKKGWNKGWGKHGR